MEAAIGGKRLELRLATLADIPKVVALQQSAYARNRELLGVEPLPLMADYNDIARRMEIWLAEQSGRLLGALILEARPEDLLVWSIACDPSTQGSGLGNSLLSAAEARARQLGHTVVRLYTGAVLEHLVAWYGRHGYLIEHIEALSDRSITHMVKQLERTA